MAKGKKKGGGKKEDQSSESNVPSEQPSTSTAAEPEEEEFGITGKPSKKQLRQQKKAAKHETPFHDKPQKEIVTEAQPSTSVAGSESSSEVPSRAQSEAPEETKQDVSKPDEIVEEFQGLLAPKKKPYRKKKKIAAEEFPTPQVATQGPVEPFGPRQLQPPTSLQPLPLAAQQTGPALLESQPTPSASGWSSGRGWSCPPPGLKATPSPGEQASSSVAPAGRGRGRGWPAPGSQPSTPLTSPGFPPQPSTSVTSPVVHSLAPQMKTSQRTTGSRQDTILCRYRIPQKISTQTIQSRKIKVITNYLEMKFKCLSIARYDVSFSPDRPKKMLPRVFQQVKNEFYSKELIAFDQMKNCYSLNPLPNVTALKPFHTTVTINDANDKSMSFDVTVKFTGMVDLSKIKHYMDTKGTSLAHPTEEVQCIDVILRQGTLESYVKAGRQFFKRPAKPIDLGHGYEMWTGLFQSAIFTEKSFINIDVAHKGFPKAQPLVDALKFDFNLNPNAPMETQRPYEVEFFTTFIKGLKVVATLVGSNPRQTREFIVNEMVAPPEKMSFMLNDPKGKNRMITVADYFAQEKGYRLQYPKLNCVWVGPKDKNIYFPMELLAVAGGQAMTRQLNEFQVAKMVREAATPPDERLRKITDVKSAMRYSKNQDFINFGLTISDKFHEVQAKVLFPPVLDTGRLGPTTPNRGQWQANSLLRPKPLESWGFVAVETDPRNEYDSMINLIMSTAKQIGMPCSTPNPVLINVKLQALHSILLKAVEKEVRFLFIIVSSRGRDHYHKVKQMAECHVGILTQCVREQTCRKMNPMTAKNILLKVNSKLMGINQAIEPKTMPRCLKEGGVMIVGADVTHPSPDQSNVPSIAAVTASLDPKCYIYNIELSVQTPKKEMIVEFEDMMVDHLKLYRERNNELPRKIFVFRDGVSEGQFAQVMNSELQAIHDAYRKLAGANKKPEILFLLVQKRHHTRLFLEGRNHNVEPGTVVDKDIVHASELDFYLVSHQAIKGTARPTRYHAVCNDGRIPDDEVEQLTYYLCHLYSRCMRSVSYPTPTYYAHLACLRARSLTHGEKFNNKELEQTPRRLRVLDKMLKFSRMFFV